MAQYATAADLGTFMGITVDTDRANEVLKAVSEEIQAYCTRVDFEQTADDTITLDGTYRNHLLVPGGPIASVSAVSVDGTSLNSSDYEVFPYKLVRRQPGAGSFSDVYGSGRHWGGPRRRVSVTYTHGFSTVPPLVAKMTLRAGARVYINPEQRRDVQLETGHRVIFERHEGVFLTKGDLMQLRNAGYRWDAENAR